MRVTETVFLVGGGETETVFTDRMDCNVYLMRAGDLYLLIDAGGGMGADQVVENIRGHGVDPARVEWLLLTHAHGDHAAGAAPLKQRLPNLKVALSAEAAGWLRSGDEKAINLDKGRSTGMYPPEFQFLPCPVDLELHDNQEVELGGKVFGWWRLPATAQGICPSWWRTGANVRSSPATPSFPKARSFCQNIGGLRPSPIHEERGRAGTAPSRPSVRGTSAAGRGRGGSPFQARHRPDRGAGPAWNLF